MGVKMRIVKEIETEGKKARALFDTGSMHTYVSRWVLEGVPIRAGGVGAAPVLGWWHAVCFIRWAT